MLFLEKVLINRFWAVITVAKQRKTTNFNTKVSKFEIQLNLLLVHVLAQVRKMNKKKPFWSTKKTSSFPAFMQQNLNKTNIASKQGRSYCHAKLQPKVNHHFPAVSSGSWFTFFLEKKSRVLISFSTCSGKWRCFISRRLKRTFWNFCEGYQGLKKNPGKNKNIMSEDEVIHFFFFPDFYGINFPFLPSVGSSSQKIQIFRKISAIKILQKLLLLPF